MSYLRRWLLMTVVVSFVVSWSVPSAALAQEQEEPPALTACDVESLTGVMAAQASVGVPSSGCGLTITSALSGTSADYPAAHGQQTGRLFRNAIPSTCASQKDTPALNDSTARSYDVYSFTNKSAVSRCVTVELQTACTSQIHALAYTSFTPATPTSGYLADTGSSSVGGPVSMGFVVGANATFSLVMHEITPAAGCSSYTFTVRGLPLHGFGPNSVPQTVSYQAGTQSGRLNRDAIPSTCASPKAGQTFGDTIERTYQRFRIKNPSSVARCATVTVYAPNCSGTNFIFAAAYSSFVPTAITTNFIADLGSSPNPATSMEFAISGSGTMDIVISPVTAGSTCTDYRVIVSGLECPYQTRIPLMIR